MEKYFNKRFAVISGCGYDGSGITRAMIEIIDWCNKKGIKAGAYEYQSPAKHWASQQVECTTFNKDNIDQIAKEINENYDVVMFHSYPTVDYSKESFHAFYDFVKKINIVKVGFDHGSTKTVVNRESTIVAISNEMDLIYAFGPNGYFGSSMNQLLKSKKFGDRIKRMNLWFNFDNLSKSRENGYDQRDRKIMYVGRFAHAKNTAKVLDVGGAVYQVDPTIKTEMHGLNSTIAVKVEVFDHKYAIRKGKVDKSGPQGCVEVYGPYQRDEMMPALAKSLFGISLFYSGKYDSNKMEYAQLEMVASGCVPIFDREWAENFEMRTGGFFCSHNYAGILVDKNNIDQDDVDLIIKVANNKKLWELYQKETFDVVKKEFDINEVLPEMLEEMSSVTEDKNKYSSIEEMLLDITKSKEFVEEYKKYKDELVILNPSQLKRNNLCLLKDKKQVMIKHFKGGE